MTFGHHPDPAVDFCVEVDEIEGMTFNAMHKLDPKKPVEDKIFRASQAGPFIDGNAQKARKRLLVCEQVVSQL